MARPRWIVATSAAGLVLLAAAGVYAHSPVPAHGCETPTRPADDQNDELWQRFLADVDAFRACISDYAESNHAAAESHRQAGNAATRDWNQFVRTDLNVPEDFPWPPRED